MAQEDKELLLQDLCGRLPYGVKMNHIANTENNPITLVGIAKTMITLESSAGYGTSDIEDYIPYLFPLSSMTEEQKKELFELCRFCIEEDWEGKKREVYAIEISGRADPAYCFDHNFYMWGVDVRAIDWLVKNHFDYRGLIDKGLAIDATNLNIY